VQDFPALAQVSVPALLMAAPVLERLALALPQVQRPNFLAQSFQQWQILEAVRLLSMLRCAGWQLPNKLPLPRK
jgi:hypothetical protein